ncbi:MAG: MipA/OmpV family protein [Gammaproteobacteria bacterium]
MQITIASVALLAAGMAACTCQTARADGAPASAGETTHIELGVGIAGAHFADYPGSSRYWNFLLPIPYITLHTPRLDANRDGVHGKLLWGNHWSLDVDFSASVPVNSSRDVEREGMPNLGWIGETGPILTYHAWHDERSGFRLDLKLPVRIAVSTDGWALHHRGWVAEPGIELARDWGRGEDRYHADLSLASLYATSQYFDYLYGVAPQYATATRPAYQAGSGRGGYRLSLGFSLHRGDMVYGAFFRYINLGGASFNASPLVSQHHQTAFGFVVAWVFRKIDQ